MGFEYLYAYQENLQEAFVIALVLGILFLAFCLWCRLDNNMDKDDWIYLTGAGFVWVFFFLILTLSPSMEHIQNVRSELLTIKQREIPNETVLYPSSECNSVRLCR